MYCLVATGMLFPALSSSQVNINGQLVDEQSTPIAFANILLLQANDSTLIKGDISLDSGNFVLSNIQPGEYLLLITYLGYQDRYQNLEVGTEHIELGDLVLHHSINELERVIVRADKLLLVPKLDRLVMNVKGTGITLTGTALDLLEQAPGVEVDRENNNIYLNGKEKIGILINDRLSRIPVRALLQMLGSMDAANIDRIELITHPPARYDAEYSGGLINIVFAQNTGPGTAGSIGLSLGQGHGLKYKANTQWNHRSAKTYLFGDLSVFRDHTYREFTNTKSIESESDTFKTTTSTYRFPIISSYAAQLGASYQLNKKHKIGLYFHSMLDQWKQKVTGDGIIEQTFDSLTRLNLFNTENSRRELYTANLNWTTQWDNQQTWNLDFNYLYYYNHNPTSYENTYHDEHSASTETETFNVTKKTPVHIWVLQSDYHLATEETWQFSAGLKATLSQLENDVYAAHSEALSERSGLWENIYAGYAQMEWKPDKRSQVLAGLRYEYSTTLLQLDKQGKVIDNMRGNFFPSLSISRRWGNRHSLQAAYNRRISRPTYSDLAPFVLFLDPSTLFQGNVALQPSVSDNFKFGLKLWQLLASVEYSYAEDAISKFQPIVAEGTRQQVFTSLNLDYWKVYSFSLIVPIELGAWWKMNYNILAVHQKLKYIDGSVLDNQYINLKSIQRFRIADQLHLELNAFYNSPRLKGRLRSSPFTGFQAALQKKIPRWEATLQLSFQNIFGRQYFNETVIGIDSPLYARTNYKYEARILTLSYTQNIGNANVKKDRSGPSGTQDIQKRIKS